MERYVLILAIAFSSLAHGQDNSEDMLAGLSALRVEDHRRAEQAFTRAVAHSPEDGKTWYYRAVNRMNMGDAEGALKDLDHLLRLDPNNGNGLLRRAEAYVQLNAPASARIDLEHAISLFPAGPIAEHAFFQLGHLAMLTGDLQVARQRYAELISIAPDNALAHCNMGIALAAMFNDPEALQELERALEIDDTLDRAHIHRAIVLLRSQRTPEACAALLQARALGDTSVDELLLIYCE